MPNNAKSKCIQWTFRLAPLVLLLLVCERPKGLARMPFISKCMHLNAMAKELISRLQIYGILATNTGILLRKFSNWHERLYEQNGNIYALFALSHAHTQRERNHIVLSYRWHTSVSSWCLTVIFGPCFVRRVGERVRAKSLFAFSLTVDPINFDIVTNISTDPLKMIMIWPPLNIADCKWRRIHTKWTSRYNYSASKRILKWRFIQQWISI